MTFADLQPPGDGTELTLELARRSHEPVAADKLRNLAALRQRLNLPLPAGAPGAPVLQPVHAATRARSWLLAPWQQLVTVGAITGALGFALGWGLSERSAPRQALAPLSVPAESWPAEPLPAETYAEPRVAAETPLAEAPGIELPEPSVAPAPARTAKARRSAPRATPSRSTSPRSAAASHDNSAPDFLEAVRLLSRARRTLDRQEPALALSLLDELDSRFPQHLLDEERAATRVFALCATGERDAALTLARRWFVERPRSIYTRRLEQSCAAEALR